MATSIVTTATPEERNMLFMDISNDKLLSQLIDEEDYPGIDNSIYQHFDSTDDYYIHSLLYAASRCLREPYTKTCLICPEKGALIDVLYYKILSFSVILSNRLLYKSSTGSYGFDNYSELVLRKYIKGASIAPYDHVVISGYNSTNIMPVISSISNPFYSKITNIIMGC